MLDIAIIRQLSESILDLDFSVSSDALETFASIFTGKRKMKTKGDAELLSNFLGQQSKEIHDIFQRLKHKTGADLDQTITSPRDNPDEPRSNYFALREIMKLEYTVISEHQSLLECFSNDEKTLLNTFNLLNADNDGIQFEAVLHLSVFVLVPHRSEQIVKRIRKNKALIRSFLEDYFP